MTRSLARSARRLTARLAPVLVLLAAGGPAALADSAGDKADLARVESYLNQARTIRANFVQLTQNGALAEGTISLERPGRVRLEYKPPTPVLVVGDGKWLTFYDSRLDQVTRYAIADTPFKVLLDDRVRIGGAVAVREVKREPGVLQVTVYDRDEPGSGAVTLVFTESPFVLRQWIVEDPQSNLISIYLNQLELNPTLDPTLFTFVDPNPFRDVNRR